MAKSIQDIITPSIKKTLMVLLSRNLPPDTTAPQLEAIIDQELFNFEYRCEFEPAFMECTEKSIENSFRKTIMQNLSFDQDFGLVWMMPRNVKVGPETKKMLECNKTVNGWINLYMQAGSLLDIATPKIKKDANGYIEEYIVGLVVPHYSTSGEISKTETKEFTFTKADFRSWQKSSHDMKASSANPGNAKLLSLCNPLYYNYSLNPDLIPNAASPGGINPAFCGTKCTGHALKRANLSKNPYTKRVLTAPYEHRRVIDEVLDIEEFMSNKSYQEDDREIPDFKPEPETPKAKPSFGAAPAKVEEPAKVEDKGAALLELAEKVSFKSEVMDIYNANKDYFDANSIQRGKLNKILTSKPEKPPVPPMAPSSSEITADNI